MESPGALPSRGLFFQLVCCFHRYLAHSSKSIVRTKTESCFQDRACSVSSFNSFFLTAIRIWNWYICLFSFFFFEYVPSPEYKLFECRYTQLTYQHLNGHLKTTSKTVAHGKCLVDISAVYTIIVTDDKTCKNMMFLSIKFTRVIKT